MSEKKEAAPVRDEAVVKKRVTSASSEILDIMALKGKAQPSGAFSVKCSDYPPEDKVVRMRHPWSIYQVPDADLKAAMGRLQKELPAKGWKIVKDGPDDSQAKSPQIVADSGDGQVSADLRLRITPPGSEYKSAIEITVVSSCFRDESGSAPKSS
ncbi:hypothetical protein HRW23_00090 [Streptomyces lunaelactis]|uniref:hypothetical protein n=1 Tax=Streptomyces lunaelactis TaxID=1535768 RepID=UPI0015846719|nr:hypothetical protein [Streptomyces lunaelactis]NUK60969.1 hypothetical protein [Streptomyces lunaelactis]NUK73466.1 hypothetical protein [Streptomyces lunaelactis]NUK75818.1 hypothetical protein [Streptomyces lunaelactis]